MTATAPQRPQQLSSKQQTKEQSNVSKPDPVTNSKTNLSDADVMMAPNRVACGTESKWASCSSCANDVEICSSNNNEENTATKANDNNNNNNDSNGRGVSNSDGDEIKHEQCEQLQPIMRPVHRLRRPSGSDDAHLSSPSLPTPPPPAEGGNRCAVNIPIDPPALCPCECHALPMIGIGDVSLSEIHLI